MKNRILLLLINIYYITVKLETITALTVKLHLLVTERLRLKQPINYISYYLYLNYNINLFLSNNINNIIIELIVINILYILDLVFMDKLDLVFNYIKIRHTSTFLIIIIIVFYYIIILYNIVRRLLIINLYKYNIDFTIKYYLIISLYILHNYYPIPH